MARKVWSTYSKFTNVAGAADVLSKLKTFCEANGWTTGYYAASVDWASDGDGTYSFAHAGDETHWQTYSNGYGNQDIYTRFKLDPWDAQSDNLNMGAINPADGSVNENISTEPYDQNNINYVSVDPINLPNASFPEMCIIGDDKTIIVICRVTTILTITFGFGNIDLLSGEQGREDNIFWWFPQQITSPEWYERTSPITTGSLYSPLMHVLRNYVVEGAYQLTDSARNMSIVGPTGILSHYWANRAEIAAMNSFSGFRTMVSVPVLVKNQTTSVWRVIGHLPYYIIPWSGLTWGQTITRGAETYMVFPMVWSTTNYGCAYRIA